ncbi:MAG: penicillin acylase family protein [Chitinophagaceae bacterium]
MPFVHFFPSINYAQNFSSQEISRWQQQANQVTIIRDNWGVPHIYGISDADVVFGLMYAQCEDNYWQLEESGIRALGRAAEIYGEKELQSDAGVALFECVNKGKEAYAKADLFLKKLCDAAAAGINFYLHKQPDLEKRLLHKYEPWFFLMPSPLNPTSHGITQMEMKNAFAQSINMQPKSPNEQLLQKESGSNTIALSPKKTKADTACYLSIHMLIFLEADNDMKPI